MKKNRLIKISFLVGSVIFSQAASAQGGAAELVQAGADAGKLTEAYLAPVFKGFGTGLNSGWANTAHSKNLGRFDLRFSVTGAIIPQKDETFDIKTLGLSNRIQPADPNKTIAPTAAGEETIGPELIVRDNNGNEIERFNLPKGAALPFVPTPQIQASIGLIKGIEVSLRAIPQVNIGDVGAINMIGGGVKVELLPLIAGKTASKILPFDVALALGYTQFSYKKDLDYTSPNGSVPDNQTIEAKISGLNTQLILSKKLLFFTPFVSVGLNSSHTDGGLKGDYRVATGVNLLNQPVYTTVKDPVTIDKKNFSAFRSDIGFQLNLAILRVYASYSASEYNSFNVGLGLGIGK